MGVFRYSATDAAGATQRGVISADSAYQVRLALRRSGLTPVRLREDGRSSDTHRPRTRGARAMVRGLAARIGGRVIRAECFEGLSALLAAGAPLAEAAETLARGAPGRAKPVIRDLAERIRRGDSLAMSMEAHARIFGPVEVALVRAAEHGGSLQQTLAVLAARAERAGDLRGRLAAALAYPALLTLIGFGVVVFLTTSTLPQLAGVLRDSGAEVPALTRALMATGGVITAAPWAPAIALIALGGLSWWLTTSDRTAALRLRTPIAGQILSRGQIGAAYVSIAELLRGGLPLDESIRLAAPSCRNTALRRSLGSIAAALAEGRSASDAAEACEAFDPVALRALRLGEESGDLADALALVGARRVASAERLVDRLSAALEPAVILALAAAIGMVAYAAIVPMLRLAQAM